MTLNGLTNFKCMDQYAPSAPEQLQGSAEDTLQIEAWLTPRFADLDASVKLPQWYLPSESEVSCPALLHLLLRFRCSLALLGLSANNYESSFTDRGWKSASRYHADNVKLACKNVSLLHRLPLLRNLLHSILSELLRSSLL